MKKIVYTYLILIFLISIPKNGLALSGACSNHGGVNCSLGADSDGSVTCNDGWKDSSVGYGSMIMCENKEDSCPKYYSDKDYEYVMGKLDSLILNSKSSTKSDCNESLASDTGFTEQYYNICLDYNKKITTSAMVNGRQPNGLKDCDTEKSKNKESNQTKYQYCLSRNGDLIRDIEIKKMCVKKDSELTPMRNSICSKITPGSLYDNSKLSCGCPAGTILGNGSCINESNYCSTLFGENSERREDGCYCKAGYTIALTMGGKKCIKDVTSEKKEMPVVSKSETTNKIEKVEKISDDVGVVKNTELKSLTQESSNDVEVKPEKIKWYKRFFNWFKRK
jgi:hypothetical protein